MGRYKYDYTLTVRADSKKLADAYVAALREMVDLFDTADLKLLASSERARRANAQARQEPKPPPRARPSAFEQAARRKAPSDAPPPPPRPSPPPPRDHLPHIPWGKGADWWQILGVAKNASWEVIRRQYRHFAAVVHPDKAGGSTARMQELNTAIAKAKKERGVK